MDNIIGRSNFFNHYFNGFDMPLFKEYQFMKTDIYENGNKYCIDIEIPGFDRENISINYDNGYITVEAVRVLDRKELDKYVRKERFVGQIKRSFFIGDKKDSDIKATYRNGVLSITFPKEEQNKRIEKNIAIN